jgi:hypothetical protein
MDHWMITGEGVPEDHSPDAIEYDDPLDTYDGWLAQGRQVRRGEKAAYGEDGEYYFHESQTAYVADDENEDDDPLDTYDGWLAQGRQVRRGEKAAYGEDGEYYFHESQTAYVD